MSRRVFYLSSHDGTPIAVTCALPPSTSAGARVPAIVRQTRYFRGVKTKPPVARLGAASAFDDYAAIRARFLDAGFAWLDVDVRGSGASFGSRPSPWSRDEVKDGAALLDWIVAQPWSSGRVGALGTSYDGTASELLASTRHPALFAIAPRFALFDVYEDVAFPGGIHLAWFTEAWGRVNRAFDANDFGRVAATVGRIVLRALIVKERAGGRAGFVRLLERLDAAPTEEGFARLLGAAIAGVEPVDEAQLEAAVRAHVDNYDVHAVAEACPYRDDIAPGDPRGAIGDEPGVSGSIDRFSPHAVVDEVRASGVAVFSYSGWYDAAYGRSAVKRHRALDDARHRLLLGPWDHGGRLHIGARVSASTYDHGAELLEFFRRHLLDARTDVPRVRWFTMGEEKWKSGDAWPPPTTTRRLFFADDRRLSDDVPASGESVVELDTEATSGEASRWRSLIGPHRYIGYPERRRQHERLVVYRTSPLASSIVVTGHPIVRLFVKGPLDDTQLFVYLDHVAPDGDVTYVSEGMLRLANRRSTSVDVFVAREHRRAEAAPLGDEVELVVIDLLPTSIAVPRGHRLTVGFAGADRANFAAPNRGASSLVLARGAAHPSALEIPLECGKTE